MRLLCIDTTAVAGSVALAEGTRLVAQEQQGVAGTHSERLLASIEHLLAAARWRCEEIEGIAVAIGPGSFTGLRIGLATAKGMALAEGIPIAGVSSLASLALNGSGFAGTVIPLIDARRDELYAAAWKVEAGGAMHPVLAEVVSPPDGVIRQLSAIDGELLLTGDGALRYGAQIAAALGLRAHIAVGTMLWPQAVNLALLAHERLAKGKGDDVATLVPNYIRHSDAEIGFLGKGGPAKGAKAAQKREQKRGKR
jgi:tRNA threonylcarbamoyladenosine biosynthesis protein TsaB